MARSARKGMNFVESVARCFDDTEQPAARTSEAALQGGLLTQLFPTTSGACFVSIFQGPAYPRVAIPPHSLPQMSRKIKQLENENRRLRYQDPGKAGSKWSNETVKKSLQMRFACGSTGYDLLLEAQNIKLMTQGTWFESQWRTHVFVV
ncbi:hypothetical protein HPB47_017109 [Ixodes persulcatus]|uniref:Uncharacterized protein n=1 Tax=Ixodes persulcatus TaxID=34615 RepID=A0AC60QP65_IXOPE|nr:hypothetical protein HPB47_017109 [Ixodes persulcatus]